MTQPAPAKLRKSSGRNPATEGPEQSGRSASGLHAHASSASLSRSASYSGSPAESPRPSHTESARQDAFADAQTISPSTSSTESLQLATTSPSESLSGTSDHAGSSQASPRLPSSAAGPATTAVASSSLPIIRSSARPLSRRAGLPSQGSSTSLARAGNPRSLHELGSDYTRYYNPFQSHNSSMTDLRSPPNGPAAGSYLTAPLLGEHADKRHSNPFDDQRRLSAVSDVDSVPQNDSKAPVMPAVIPVGMAMGDIYRGLDPEKSFFPYLDDRLGAPGADAAYDFPMMWDEKEEDDEMHMPGVDDDVRYKPTWRDRFSRANICSLVGVIFMLLGLFCLFIVLPVLSSQGISTMDYPYDTPISEFGSSDGAAWAHVNDVEYPLLSNLRTSLIDPDTPSSAKTKTSLVDGQTLNLVFSDEFNDDDRTFYPGDDPYFFAFNGWYGATEDLEWYDPDAITTSGGALTITMDKYTSHDLDYRSGMLNSWNQLCFKGGIWEVSVSLPGPAGVHGLWPGIWSMGNLGRPGYLSTTDGLWPYTYNSCDAGITPNQSMSDGTSHLPGQRLPSCTCEGADHPSPGTGRGAPEIDIIEVAADYGGHGWATATQSFQVAPFDIWYYPNYEYFYIPDYNVSFINTYVGGIYQQAVSTTSVLNNAWFNGTEYQTYAYDYVPGANDNSSIAWMVGDQIMAGFTARALGPNGNIGQRLISEEPMSMILNVGISESWTTIDFTALYFPTTMHVDYIRLYQREGEESVTCDPPGYETTEYIANHPEAYTNPNYTKWDDIPGYTTPKNSYMSTC